MARWVAFDRESAASLEAGFDTAVEWREGDAISCALRTTLPSVVLLPSDIPGNVLLVQVEAGLPDKSGTWSPEQLKTGEATGFLGLVDEPVYEDEPRPKKWWQKLLE